MRIYRLLITSHDSTYWATREVDRLYQSEAYLHNYALTYALGLAKSTYHDNVQIPRYQEELSVLNEVGVYVTPAAPVCVDFVGNTYKFADTRYHVEMEQCSYNVPTFGMIREIAAESQFVCYVLAEQSIRLPKWIRLGKWMSKAGVQMTELPVTEGNGSYVVGHPLNPLDIGQLPTLFDLINMPPVSLVNNVHLMGAHYKLPNTCLPKDLAYRF